MAFVKKRIEAFPKRQDIRQFDEKWLARQLTDYATKNDGSFFDCLGQWECPTVCSIPILSEEFGKILTDEMAALKKSFGSLDLNKGLPLDLIELDAFAERLVEYLLRVSGWGSTLRSLKYKGGVFKTLGSREAESSVGTDLILSICLAAAPTEDSDSLHVSVPRKLTAMEKVYHATSVPCRGSHEILTELVNERQKEEHESYEITPTVGRGILYSPELPHDWAPAAFSVMHHRYMAGASGSYIVLRFAAELCSEFERFTDLPSDLQLEIFGYLNAKDLVSLCMAHRSFNNLLHSDQADVVVWQSLFHTTFEDLDLKHYVVMDHVGDEAPSIEEEEKTMETLPLDSVSWKENFKRGIEEMKHRRTAESEKYERRHRREGTSPTEKQVRSTGAHAICDPAFTRSVMRARTGNCYLQ